MNNSIHEKSEIGIQLQELIDEKNELRNSVKFGYAANIAKGFRIREIDQEIKDLIKIEYSKH